MDVYKTRPDLPPNNVTHLAIPAGDGQLDYLDLVSVLRRHYTVVLACVAVITIICATVVFQLVPRYTAEASLILDPRKTPQVLNVQEVLSGLPADTEVVQGEVQVLKSNSLAEEVVKRTNLIAEPEFNARLRSSTFLTTIVQPVYWAVSFIQSLLNFAPNAPEPDPARAELVAVSQVLQEHLDVVNDGSSSVLTIRVQSENPKLAATLANTYASAYLDAQLDAKFAALQRANAWLNQHMADLRSKAEDSDRAVQIFAAQNNLTLDRQGTTVTEQQVSEINTQLVLASADLAQKEANLNQVQSLLKSGGVSAAAQVLSSPVIQNLREQETALAGREADLATRYKPDHPAIINIKAQERDLDIRIGAEIDRIVGSSHAEVNSAQAKVDSLRKSLNDLQQNGNQNDAIVRLHELQREAEANRTIYEDFLNRFKQTTTQEDIQQADARIISEAWIPTVPSYPKKLRLIGFAFLCSLMLGVVAAYGLERLDNGFRTSEQFEKLINLPVLGLEPNMPKGEPPYDIVVSHPVSPYAEAMRSIRTALRYSNVDTPPKVVVVTSSVAKEGKTVFSVSLARSVNQSGGKALLIDCDLRRPSIGKLFGVETDPGLLAYFDDGADESKIVKIDSDSGLHFIPVASGTSNPQDLLDSNQMRALIDKMRTVYDLIVLDTPPVLSLSDAGLLSQSADATIFLVRWGRTPRSVVSSALKSFRTTGGKIAGIVLSRVDMRSHARYAFGDPHYSDGYYGEYKSRDVN
jgi:capsular exopolysaccharide synthesis family protein